MKFESNHHFRTNLARGSSGVMLLDLIFNCFLLHTRAAHGESVSSSPWRFRNHRLDLENERASFTLQVASNDMPMCRHRWVIATVLAGMLVTLVTAHMNHHHHNEMQVHRDLASSITDYECPVCGMSTMDSGYDNENYVVLTHGQKIYTCGMGPQSTSDYTFKVRNVEYLAANMAEFIVNPSSADYAACEDGCAECEDGVKDPVSSDAVTKDNYAYVCLDNGQKIYFASHVNRKMYLDNVNSMPRHLVDNVVCSKATCSDATKITTLSSAALKFVSDYSSSSGSGTSTGSSDTMSSSSTFCTGQGSVMFNGFQTSINGSCVMLIFQPWVLNSAVKYAFGFIGCFLIAILNESLVKAREVVRQKLLKARKLRPKDKLHKVQCKLMLSLLYMIQMTIAYFAMLVVMTYETGLFVALIAGFGAGFMLFKNVNLDITEERGAWRFTNPSTVRIEVGGMSCKTNCGTAVETAIKNTPGVADAIVEFDEKTVYVLGSAAVRDLIAAIEAVGYTATVRT